MGGELDPNRDREGAAGPAGLGPLPYGRGTVFGPVADGRGSVAPLRDGRGFD